MTKVTVTPLNEPPLHGFDLDPDQWWACTRPEAPANDSTAYDGRCPSCVLAAEARVAIGGDTPIGAKKGGVLAEVQLSELIELARKHCP